MNSAGALSAHDLSKCFAGVRAVDRVTLRVDDAERFLILGPSGAGKTTLLRLLAGLDAPQSGRVFAGGRDVTNEPAHRRGLAMVFPHGALLPGMSVLENLSFVHRGTRAQLNDCVEAFGLRALTARRPATLSGGERQRAALARALLAEPHALLLDEPLALLDPPGREAVRALLLEITRRRERAVLIVTHDHEEALATADRLAIMIGGQIVQCDTPEKIYERPASAAVAKFLGPFPMNVIATEGVHIGIRPQHVRVNNGAADLEGIVSRSEFAGGSWIARVQTRAGEVLVQHPSAMPQGERVRLAFPPENVRNFDPRTGDALE